MNSLEIKKKLKKNNLLIIINNDGMQTIYEAPVTHFGTLLEVVKIEYIDLYNRVLEDVELQDLIPLIAELIKKKLVLICKHTDIYGIFLPQKYSSKQKIVLLKDILLTSEINFIYSGIYNEKRNDFDYLNKGYLMKKLEFVREFNSKKLK